MNSKIFEQQVNEFISVLQQFPSPESFWNGNYLKIFIFQEIEWDIRVCFSFAFNTPVLYFRPRTQAVDLETLLTYTTGAKQYISQIEFPLTGEPFFFLHPCRSSDLFEIGDFAAWLSVVLQVINARLPMELFKLIADKKQIN